MHDIFPQCSWPHFVLFEFSKYLKFPKHVLLYSQHSPTRILYTKHAEEIPTPPPPTPPLKNNQFYCIIFITAPPVCYIRPTYIISNDLIVEQ